MFNSYNQVDGEILSKDVIENYHQHSAGENEELCKLNKKDFEKLQQDELWYFL